MNVRFFHFLFGAYFALVAPALAKDLCNFLTEQKEPKPRLPPLQDGQLYARAGTVWQSFGSLSELIARSPQETEFAYVIRTHDDTDRTGVLAIKTNRPTAETDSPRLRERVKLARRNITKDPKCADNVKVGRENSNTSVSTQAFRDYHDTPARATDALRAEAEREEGFENSPQKRIENDTLRDFHFQYHSARKRKCIRTDNDDDDDFPFNGNSNRAQFSFDRTVVARGAYSALRLVFWVPASPFEGSSDHRVLVRKYETDGGLACVRFRVEVDSPNYTFQISDLESRVTSSSIDRKGQQIKRWPGAR
jgi:hypothetical protein